MRALHSYLIAPGLVLLGLLPWVFATKLSANHNQTRLNG
jgi:hypothetical protein